MKNSKTKAYECWLGYRRLEDTSVIKEYRTVCGNIVLPSEYPVAATAASELSSGIKGMLGITPKISESLSAAMFEKAGGQGFILLGVIGKPPVSEAVPKVEEAGSLKEEGFVIKPVDYKGIKCILIAGKTDKGVLYGAFSFLRGIQCLKALPSGSIVENPKNPLRIINQWDNMNGNIERGYAGKSFFYKNNRITGNLKRIEDYTRLLSSIGLNGIVINNVNVHKYETQLITGRFLPKVAQLAGVFRRYGVKLYLSVNYAATVEIGGLSTADPLDPDVRRWWKEKADEIYKIIPDFGGFLVKADSEFRPGPFTYNRNHAEGANMLAEAIGTDRGLVIWRCFVYNCKQDWRDYKTDRARAAYDTFKPIDGQFMDNVILQIKNGPMDFQVREPISSLFGGLKETNQTVEFEVTQEYTGQQVHLCYLVPMWKEVLDFDTMVKGKGSYVKDIVSGELFGNKTGGFAAVSNVGENLNWTGHPLAQSNFYGYGRLAWNPDLSSEEIADEWIRLTYGSNKKVIEAITEMLMKSREIYENYTSPLGVGWMVNPSYHYGPSVDGYEYAKWGCYHRADFKGIGIDRTMKTGTGYTGQYHKEVAQMYENLDTCPEELVLFFHYLPYDYRLKSGKNLLQHIYDTHFLGAEQAQGLRDKWLQLKDSITDDRFGQIAAKLDEQTEHSKEWRDVVNTYFYRKTGIPDQHGRKIY